MHPRHDPLKQCLFYSILSDLSDGTCCRLHFDGEMGQIGHFQYDRHEKYRNIKSRNFHSSNSNYHNYTNLTSKYMFLKWEIRWNYLKKNLTHHWWTQNPRWPPFFNKKSFRTPNQLISHSSYCFKLAQNRCLVVISKTQLLNVTDLCYIYVLKDGKS